MATTQRTERVFGASIKRREDPRLITGKGVYTDDIKLPDRRPIAVDKVRYVGEAVAVVIADSPYLAKDAAERVEVDYEELPVVADAEAAMAEQACLVHEHAERNACFHWSL